MMPSPFPGMDPFLEKNPIFYHLVYAWRLREALPMLPIPLLGTDQAFLDLGACFSTAYDRIAADDEAEYEHSPPPPELTPTDEAWMSEILHLRGHRR